MLYAILYHIWHYKIWPHNTNVGISTVAAAVLGWGLLSQFPPFRYFPKFSSLSKHTLTVEYRVYIRQVSPQLSCGDTCQIWMSFKESNMYFCKIENFAYGEINERSFCNPHPWCPQVPGHQQALQWLFIDDHWYPHLHSLSKIVANI